MDFTVEGVIERVKRDSALASRGPVYTLSSTHTAGETTVHLNEVPSMAGPGSIASMGVSSYYITSADQIAKTLNVIPSYHGTVDDTHSPPMVIYIDDPMPGGAILDHIYKEIRSWRKKLWRVLKFQITSVPTQRVYNWTPTGDVIDLLEVRRAPAGKSWLNWAWNDDRYPRVKSKLIRNTDDSIYTNTLSLHLDTLPPEGTLFVAYAAPFDLSTLDLTTDLVATVGLEEDWIEILDSGVRARTLQAGIASRGDWRTGGHTRNAEQVSLLDVVRAAQAAQAERDMALAAAANALRAQWPYGSA
jgi:hypothetical protein